jgi:hypothetical protein
MSDSASDTTVQEAADRYRRVLQCRSNDEVCAVYGVEKWGAGAWHRERDERTLALAYLAEHLEPNPEHEATAAKFRAEQRQGDGSPDGARESLERCARMLDTYAPDLYPANEKGQVHFARATMESVADEIRAYLASGYEPTEDDAVAFINRTAEAEPFSWEWDRVSRVAYSTRSAVARMMLAFRAARWATRPCLVCGQSSTGVYQGRADFPTCGSSRCELKMQGGIDAAEKGLNR